MLYSSYDAGLHHNYCTESVCIKQVTKFYIYFDFKFISSSWVLICNVIRNLYHWWLCTFTLIIRVVIVPTGGTGSSGCCHYDNSWSHQWQQGWHHDNFLFSYNSNSMEMSFSISLNSQTVLSQYAISHQLNQQWLNSQTYSAPVISELT